MATIFREIDQAKFTTSDPEVIIAAKEAGLVGEQLGIDCPWLPGRRVPASP